jgi:Beta-propeller repeat/Domain of unknown function DUF11
VILLTAAALAVSGSAFHLAGTVHAADNNGTQPGAQRALPAKSSSVKSVSSKSFSSGSSSSTSMSVPLFFEPNQGQTDPQVKFLARGSGYGLFLTADEAVLHLQPKAAGPEHSTLSPQPASSVIRMKLEGASPSALVSGTSPLPGKSNYFIGSDSSKWRQNIPQFGGVQYQAVYPGIDLIYYGNRGQMEYDFRVAPGADPSQIALTFSGASARLVPADSDGSGDLILSTANGDILFHAPRIYQAAVPASSNSSARAEKTIQGSFRKLADNRIGFTIGDYDHGRELVIDPVLSYSTYLGGTGKEGFVQVAVDADLLVYVAGSTTSTDFPTNTAAANNPNNPPYQPQPGVAGAQNIFIAVLNPTLTGATQLVYATYLGGSGADTLAGLAVDSAFGMYVAGTTTSIDFPTTTNAFQQPPSTTGIHGFLSKIAFTGPAGDQVYSLTYSTYLAGDGYDIVAGLAVDNNQNAYVTGSTTSSNPASDFFPANPNGYQVVSNSPGNPQFFASKINTNGSGKPSMLYSTYFGGGYPDVAIAGCSAANLNPPCGGIALDPSGNMYITSWTNMLPVKGPNGEAAFPLFDAQQPCLNQGSTTTTCLSNSPTTITDAFIAKFNPNYAGPSSLIYSTYLGGNGVDMGLAIAVDSSSNAYVTGSTTSTNWVCECGQFQTTGYGGNGDAFIAKIGGLSGSVYPMNYFTYLGGAGTDVGNAIQVDTAGSVHVAGSTSGALPFVNPIQPGPTSNYDGSVYGGGGDAFVASISTSSGGTNLNPAADSLSYLGGNGLDQGTGIALDIYGATYVAGNTASSNFPTANPFHLTNGSQDAFVSKLGALSTITLTTHSASPSPSPATLGAQVAFTFDITNTGPDNASQVNFFATIAPNTGLASLSSLPTGRVTGGTGTCNQAEGQTEIVPCFIPLLSAGAVASIEIDVTTNAATLPVVTQISASGSANANGSGITINSPSQTVQVVDFTISASTPTPTVTAGQTASIALSFCPSNPELGYSATITPTDSIQPSMVTAVTPTFNPTTVTLSGSACASTTLTIATVARPVTSGTLLHRGGSFYVVWLPMGGLSLVGLGIGAGRKRRRWLLGGVLGLIAGIILLLPSCGSASTSTTTAGGTLPGVYNVTVTGAAGTGASHNRQIQIQVN